MQCVSWAVGLTSFVGNSAVVVAKVKLSKWPCELRQNNDVYVFRSPTRGILLKILFHGGYLSFTCFNGGSHLCIESYIRVLKVLVSLRENSEQLEYDFYRGILELFLWREGRVKHKQKFPILSELSGQFT